MNRAEAIEIIATEAGPLGPLSSFDPFDNSVENWTKWLKQFDESSLDALIDLLVNPITDKELGYEVPKAFDCSLDEALSYIGNKDFEQFSVKIENHLNSSVGEMRRS